MAVLLSQIDQAEAGSSPPELPVPGPFAWRHGRLSTNIQQPLTNEIVHVHVIDIYHQKLSTLY